MKHAKQWTRFFTLVFISLMVFAITGVSAQNSGEPVIHPSLLKLAQTSAGGSDSGANAFQPTLLDGTPVSADNFPNIRYAPDAVTVGDYVRILAEANGNGQALLTQLNALGFRGSAKGSYVAGLLPLSAVNSLPGLSALSSVTPQLATTNTGSVAGEAIQALAVDIANGVYGVDGSGLTIGIISDSFDCVNHPDNDGTLANVPNPTTYADDIASGDLPAGIEILEDIPCNSGAIDEGRAMAQLIYDVAPGVEMKFHTAFLSEWDFADGIVELIAAGSDIVVDDIGYITAPFFQDGAVALSADYSFNNGVPYFSSAGNADASSFNDNFRPSGVVIQAEADDGNVYSYELHDFDPGSDVDLGSNVILPGAPDGANSPTQVVVIHWDDPYATLPDPEGGLIFDTGATTDLDLFILNAEANTVLLASPFFSDGFDPWDFYAISNGPGPVEDSELSFAVGARVGSDYSEDTYFNVYPWSNVNFLEYAGSPTLFGHSNASGTMAVGASAYFFAPAFGQSPPLLNSFSSLGGTPILYDTYSQSYLPSPEIRQRPQITATDGTNTTFFFSDSGDDAEGNPNFFGTSAAAPHAAAVAALMMQQNPNLTPSAIEKALMDSAIDIVQRSNGPTIDTGIDFWSGAGLIQADIAVGLVTPAINVGPTDLSGDVGSQLDYQIELASVPADGAVNISITSDGSCQISPSSLSFDITNYSEPQLVNVTSDSDTSCNITHAATGSPDYNGLTGDDVYAVFGSGVDTAGGGSGTGDASGGGTGDGLSIVSVITSGIVNRGEGETLQFTITNNTGTTINSPSMSIQAPTGLTVTGVSSPHGTASYAEGFAGRNTVRFGNRAQGVPVTTISFTGDAIPAGGQAIINMNFIVESGFTGSLITMPYQFTSDVVSQTGEATILLVSQLPATGETPFWRNWLMLVLVIGAAGAASTTGLVAYRRRNNVA